jgi:uncharacterized RDD family membrane protein YckC
VTDAIAPATLSRRTLGFLVDYVVIAAWLVAVVALGALARTVAPELGTRLFADPVTGQASGFVLLTLPVGLYFALLEAGPRGATIGKRRLRVRVVTAEGRAMGLGRSLARTALKLVSWELSHAIVWRFATPGSAPEALLQGGLVVVWALVGANVVAALVDPARRTLYDRLSSTRVVSDSRFSQ